MQRKCDYCKSELYVKNEEFDDFTGRNEVTYVCKNKMAQVFDYEQKRWKSKECLMYETETKYIE